MMRTLSGLLLLSLIGAATLVVAPRPVLGHALLVTPPPRDMQDGYKDPPRAPPGTGAPCGISEAASQPHTNLTSGAMTVNWKETVNHPGCFVVDFSPAGDANWVQLAVKSHMNPPSASVPRNWSVGVTIPSAPCTKCTLRVRQLMLNNDVTDAQCPPATIPAGATYYSCANITIGGSTGTGGTTGAAGTSGGGGRAGSVGRGGTTGTAGTTGAAGTSAAAGTTGAAGTSAAAGTTGAAGT